MTIAEYLATVVAELLRDDPRRVLLGEDVAEGGMLGLSRVATQDEALASRLVSTPLVPTIMAAHAGGLAAGGRRPIVLLPTVAALVEALAGLREIAALSHRGGAGSAPVLFVAPYGPGFGLGADAVEATDAVLTRVPGLRVLCVGQATDAGAMLRAAADFWLGDEPTVVLVPRGLLLRELEDDAPPPALERPLGGVHRLREGAEATVFAWGEAVDIALQAAASSGHGVTVVDVVSLAPLDRAGLVAAARETGKIVITHAGPREGGLGAELAALFADEAILHLDAPVIRVTGDDGPLLPMDEARALPRVDQLSAAITQVATY